MFPIIEFLQNYYTSMSYLTNHILNNNWSKKKIDSILETSDCLLFKNIGFLIIKESSQKSKRLLAKLANPLFPEVCVLKFSPPPPKSTTPTHK